ncbi:hypothetical protein [Streptomyces tuirus]
MTAAHGGPLVDHIGRQRPPVRHRPVRPGAGFIGAGAEGPGRSIDGSYHSLRDIREALASGCTIASEEYQAARQIHGDATRAARVVLRADLAALEA